MRDTNAMELVLWLVGLRRRYRVAGASMQPSLYAGEEVLVDPRAFRRHAPHRGDLVVARHPGRTELQIIKRVAMIEPDGRCLLRGENPDPNQSSDFLVPAELLLGRVTSRFGSARI